MKGNVMTGLPPRLVGDAYRNGIAWETLETLVDAAPRMAGHEGEADAMNVVVDAFEDAGLREVGIESFEIPAWFRGSAALALVGTDREFSDTHQLVALPGTPAGEVQADLVDVGHGTPEEFDDAAVAGNVVIAESGTPEGYDRWFHRREKYDAAVERGAVGFLFRSHVPGCLPPTGDIGDEESEGAIPGVGVSRELGSRLVRHCRDGDVETSLSVDCYTERTDSGNVSGRLGPETERELLVTAHHDAHDIAEGAKDNGAGCALVAEIARLLAGVEDELETGVRFVTFGAEEIGLRGSRYAVAETDLDGIEAVLNLDGIGDSRDIALDTHGFAEIGAAFDAVSEDHGVPIEVREQVNTHSDHWPFAREGVPAAMAYSVGGSDERGWGHTHADTLDKLDRRDFRDLAVALAGAVHTLAGSEYTPQHVDGETVQQRAREEGYDV